MNPKVEQILRSRKLDAAIAKMGMRVRDFFGHQFAQFFVSEQNFSGLYFAQLFMFFALFAIHSYIEVSTEFKGNLAALKF